MPQECDRKVLSKLAEDEPIFILRAQDKLAPDVVNFWITLARARGVPEPKLEHAEVIHRQKMLVWQQQHPERVKLPD